MSIELLLVDDDPDIRMLLRMWVEDTPEDIVVVGEAAGALDALALLDELDPDVILVDARMPAIDGFEAAEMILARRPWQKLVMYTGGIGHELSEKALAAGFAACVPKDDYARLPAIIAEVAQPDPTAAEG